MSQVLTKSQNQYFFIKEGSMGDLFCQAQSVFVFAGKRICILQAGVSVFCRPGVFALVGLSRLTL